MANLDLLNQLLESAMSGDKGPMVEPVKPQQGPTGIRRLFSDILAGASGRVGATDAESFMREGLPNLRGIPTENINAVLSDPARKMNVAAIKENIEDRPYSRVLKIAQAQKAIADAKIASRLAGVKDNDELRKLLELYLKGQKATGIEGTIGQPADIVETTKALTEAIGEKAKKKLGIKDKAKTAKTSDSQYLSVKQDTEGHSWGLSRKTNQWEQVK